VTASKKKGDAPLGRRKSKREPRLPRRTVPAVRNKEKKKESGGQIAIRNPGNFRSSLAPDQEKSSTKQGRGASSTSKKKNATRKFMVQGMYVQSFSEERGKVQRISQREGVYRL